MPLNSQGLAVAFLATVVVACGSSNDAGNAATSPSAAFSYQPSNVPSSVLPRAGVLGALTLTSSNCAIDTDTLTLANCGPDATSSKAYTFVAAAQSDQSMVAVLAVDSLEVSASASVTLKGAAPLVIVAATTVSIEGSFVAQPALGGANGGGFACTSSGTGGGPGAGSAGQGGYGGAGGGGYCGHGGAGVSTMGQVAANAGGKGYGTATLTPLLGGSSGGGTDNGGGRGGGGVQISAGTSITIGSGGAVSMPGYAGGDNGAGGGSGGAILIEAPTVTILGVLAANGGGGAEFHGGNGNQSGQPDQTPAMGSAHGGVGGAGSSVDGGEGSAGTGNNDHGAGGGAVGRIRINSSTGAATVGSAATISPLMSGPCATEGKL